MRRGLLFFLLGVAALTGCASGGSARAAGPVPWVDRPLPLYHVPAAKPIRYPTTAPPCRAGQLRVSQGHLGGAAGNEAEPFLFTNIGSNTCLLRGYPTVSAETATGSRQALHPHHGIFFGPLVPTDLPRGHHAFLDFGTGTGCDGGAGPVVRYRQLAFALPQGGVVRAGKATIAEQCGLTMSDFGLPERYAGPRPGTPGALRAGVHLTARLRTGSTDLRYTVTLSNPTAKAVRLKPCPGYTEGVYTSGLAVHRSFALDCGAVHVIPAHGHVVYAMRLALPHGLAAGVVKLGWNLDTANGPFAGKGLVVTKS